MAPAVVARPCKLFERVGADPRTLRQGDADEDGPLRADRQIVAVEFEGQDLLLLG